MVIWKYPLGRKDRHVIQMQKGARVLTAQLQKGMVCVWAVCDDFAAQVNHVFAVRETGDKQEMDGVYVATIQESSGIVLHVFDCGEE